MDEKRMPLAGHLTELRARVIVCLLATLAGTIVAYCYCPSVFLPMLRAPLDALQGNRAKNPYVLKTALLEALARRHREKAVLEQPGAATAPDAVQAEPPPVALHYLTVVTPFLTRLKIALIVGIILVLPVIVYQVWAFVSAGLYPHERRYVLMYGPASFVLFLAGAALCYFVVLPLGVAFLLEQGAELGLGPMLTIGEYTSFVLWLLLGFGLIFQMPLAVLFLTKVGLVSPEMLSRSRRFAIFAIFIIAAVITPPDVFTQIAMALPMVGLYELSIFLSRLAAKKADAARER